MSPLRCYYDLHLHSCLSPCGDGDMTPANLAAMCALAGLHIAALTDHNTSGNCAAFQRAAARLGLLALAGMELCTREEVHLVCLFPSVEQADIFSARVDEATRPWPANAPAIFGPQLYMDDADGILGEDPRLLAGASALTLAQAAELVAQLDGVCYPAHIDRPSFSLLSNLGLWDPTLNFPLAEVSPSCPANFPARPDLAGVRLITGSDAHYLHQLPDPVHWMDLEECSPRAVLRWLKG